MAQQQNLILKSKWMTWFISGWLFIQFFIMFGCTSTNNDKPNTQEYYYKHKDKTNLIIENSRKLDLMDFTFVRVSKFGDKELSIYFKIELENINYDFIFLTDNNKMTIRNLTDPKVWTIDSSTNHKIDSALQELLSNDEFTNGISVFNKTNYKSLYITKYYVKLTMLEVPEPRENYKNIYEFLVFSKRNGFPLKYEKKLDSAIYLTHEVPR